MSNLYAFKCVVESYRHSSTRKRGSLLSSGAEYRRRAWLCTTVEESWDSRHRLTLDTLHDDATRWESSFYVDDDTACLCIFPDCIFPSCSSIPNAVTKASPRLCYFEFHKNTFKMAYLNRCSDFFFHCCRYTLRSLLKNIPIFLIASFPL